MIKRAIVVTAAAVLLAAGNIYANPFYWDPTGGDSQITEGSGNWDAAIANWTIDAGTNNVTVTGTDPFAEDIKFGSGTTGTAGTVTLTASGMDFGSLDFLPSASGTYNIDLNGNSVRFRRSSNTILISEDALVSDGTGGGVLNVHGDSQVRFSANKTLSISAVVGQTAVGTITVYTGGTLDLSGANTFTNSLNLKNQSQVVISGGGTLGNGSYPGGIIMEQGTDFTYSSTATQTISGVISDDYPEPQSNDIIKDNTGILILTATNTYAGNTFINGGTLLVNGDHNGGKTYTVAGGGTLGGTGSIGTNIVFNAGSSLAGGDSSGYGTLTLSEGLTLAADVTNLVVVGDTLSGQYSAIAVTGGTIDLGGAALTVDDAAFEGTGEITIIDNQTGSGVTGTFAGLAEGARVTGAKYSWMVTYNSGAGNDVTLTYLPASTVIMIR